MKNILVPVDFSETSMRALDYAVDLAKQLDGSVTVLHAYEVMVYMFPDGSFVPAGDFGAQVREAADRSLDKAIEARLDRGVPMRKELRNGVTNEQIVEAAQSLKADVIVLGTHGRKGISRALIGSVAEKLVRTSPVPVLTVH